MKKRCRKSGKIKFDTREQAMKRAGEVLGYKATKVKALGTYRCSFCNKWHLTSKI